MNRWDSEQWYKASVALWYRCGDRCEYCGRALHNRAERHHRQRRRVGGDRLANLLMVHPECHAAIHREPVRSRDMGWIVSSYEVDPALVSVWIGGRVWTLDDDGGKTPVP